MAGSNTSPDSLLLGEDERGIFLAPRGHIRANLCWPLRESVLARLEGPSAVPAVYIDLSLCRYMDSTFIGLLVAIDKRLRKESRGCLHVLRPTPECRDILQQLGLESILLIEERSVDPPAVMKEVVEAGKPGAEFVLKAHEALIETSEEAKRRFGLLRETLERKLRGEKPPRDTP